MLTQELVDVCVGLFELSAWLLLLLDLLDSFRLLADVVRFDPERVLHSRVRLSDGLQRVVQLLGMLDGVELLHESAYLIWAVVRNRIRRLGQGARIPPFVTCRRVGQADSWRRIVILRVLTFGHVDGVMGLWRPEKDHVSGAGAPAFHGEVLRLSLLDRRRPGRWREQATW